MQLERNTSRTENGAVTVVVSEAVDALRQTPVSVAFVEVSAVRQTSVRPLNDGIERESAKLGDVRAVFALRRLMLKELLPLGSKSIIQSTI